MKVDAMIVGRRLTDVQAFARGAEAARDVAGRTTDRRAPGGTGG